MIKHFVNSISRLILFLICMFGPFYIGSISSFGSWYSMPLIILIFLWWLVGAPTTAYLFLKSIGINIGEILK